MEEDVAFANFAGLCLNDLSLIDAPERLAIAVGGISSTRPLSTIDEEPRREIAHHVRTTGASLVLTPLTVGDHIDHRIATAGVMDCGSSSIGFYEDLPYASRNPEDRIHELVACTGKELYPWIVRADDGYAWKYACSSLYKSQISRETAEEIALYSARYENGERYWMTAEALQFVRSLDQE